ncbi:MAG: esterase/lipase family protein [Pseudomonadales bacterium]
MIGWAARGWVLLSLVLVASCSNVVAPDFDELYSVRTFETRRSLTTTERPNPAIVIPGLLGSRLVHRETGREIWPGSLRHVLFSRYEQLALPFDVENLTSQPDPLEVQGITETAAGRDFYGRLLSTLTDYGGYTRTELGEPISDRATRRVYVFAYDWRQDNVRTAQSLAEFLDQIRLDYNEPELKFDLIAHSMGGLMARYFLRYGTEDVLDDNRLTVTWAGAAYINKMVLLGTPNMGAISSIEGLIHGQQVGLRKIPQEVVATMPSSYQLFPHRLVDWLYSTDGRLLNRDPFNVKTWQDFEWGIFAPNVRQRMQDSMPMAAQQALPAFFERAAERARRFSWALTVCPNYDEELSDCPEEVAEPPIKLVVFGGDCSLTPSRAVIEESDNGETMIRFWPKTVSQRVAGVNYDRLMLDPGDGTVTKPSLLARDALSPYTPRHAYSYFPLAYAFFLCADHTQLTGNVHFQDNLLDLLLTRARPWELHQDHQFAR